jgi:hypothetical protein
LTNFVVVSATLIITNFQPPVLNRQRRDFPDMPRPPRKPKRFDPPQTRNIPNDAPVASTPLYPKQSTTGILASPGLSPIKPESEFSIKQDPPGSDEFGFSRVKGVKKCIPTIHLDVNIDEEDNDVVDYDSDDEVIYGEQLPIQQEIQMSNISNSSPSPPLPPQPKKIINTLRTSELLHLLPARKKRHTSRPQKKVVAINTSDMESDEEPFKLKGKKRRVSDKENDVPDKLEREIDSEEELKMEKRKQVIKSKFAEVDKWEMAFESVDVSFSSQ